MFLAPYAYRRGDQLILYRRVLLEPISPDVVLLAAAGIALIFATFFVVKRTLFARLPRFRLPGREPSPQVLTALYTMLLAASLAYHHIATVRALPSVGQFLDPAAYLALGGFYLQWRSGDLARWQVVVLLLVAAPLEFWWRLKYLFMTDLLMLPLFFVFVLWRERQFKLITALVVAGSLVAVSYSATIMARNHSSPADNRFVELASYIGKLVRGEAESRFPDQEEVRSVVFDPRIAPLVARIGQIWVFQTVYERSPEPIPYLNGVTYRPLLTSFIPRFIYPDKPEERAGALFGNRYGFTPDTETSVNIPWIIELLANFGPTGVLMGMVLFGLFLGFLDKVFNSGEMSDLEFLIGLTLFFRLCYQESNFSVMTGSLLPLFVSLVIYFCVGGRFSIILSSRK